MAVGAALFGTTLMFTGAWLTEKTRDFHIVRGVVQLLAFLPMAVPGLVLGLGYIFFFNAPGNPLGFLYATMAHLGGQHGGALLHGRPSDGDDGPEADRPGVRIRLRLAQGPDLAHLLPGSRPRSACRPSSTSRSTCSSTR
jgi:hypothetical protein